MFQREVATSLIAFRPPDFAQSVSYLERRSDLASHLECLLVQLARCSPLALRMQRDSQRAEARVKHPEVTHGARAVHRFARQRLGLRILPLTDREECQRAEHAAGAVWIVDLAEKHQALLQQLLACRKVAVLYRQHGGTAQAARTLAHRAVDREGIEQPAKPLPPFDQVAANVPEPDQLVREPQSLDRARFN